MSGDKPQSFVLDSSAWITLLEDENGADQVQQLLDKAAKGEIVLFSSFMSYMEVYYISLQESGGVEAKERLQLMQNLPVQRHDSNYEVGVYAAQIKVQYRLSVADAWIAGLAQSLDATLVHKDPEFAQVADIISMLELPFK